MKTLLSLALAALSTAALSAGVSAQTTLSRCPFGDVRVTSFGTSCSPGSTTRAPIQLTARFDRSMCKVEFGLVSPTVFRPYDMILMLGYRRTGPVITPTLPCGLLINPTFFVFAPGGRVSFNVSRLIAPSLAFQLYAQGIGIPQASPSFTSLVLTNGLELRFRR